MAQTLSLLGVDIGTTTSHCILVRAQVETDPVFRSKKLLVQSEILYESQVSMTPFQHGILNESALAGLLSGWLIAIHKVTPTVDTGGVIITGLASRSENCSAIKKVLGKLLPFALVLTAQDPRLESWVSWHGSCGLLSLGNPEDYFLNIDIGGGTSNVAIGKNGQVIATGSYFIGARHFLYRDGNLVPVSEFASRLGVNGDADRIAGVYVSLLEKIVAGQNDTVIAALTQAPLGRTVLDPRITFSGGVGELVYAKKLPDRFCFGDLGPTLALAIRQSKILSKDITDFEPIHKTRATAIGLGLHNTWISGTSIHVCDFGLLPITNIPIVGKVAFSSTAEVVKNVLGSSVPPLSAIQVTGLASNFEEIQRLATILKTAPHRLVILVEKNFGKVLGGALSSWRVDNNFMVLDEVDAIAAHFVSIGKAFDNSVPLSYFGLY